MTKLEEISKEYMDLVVKERTQPLSYEEKIIKYTLAWVKGYARLSPSEFIKTLGGKQYV